MLHQPPMIPRARSPPRTRRTPPVRTTRPPGSAAWTTCSPSLPGRQPARGPRPRPGPPPRGRGLGFRGNLSNCLLVVRHGHVGEVLAGHHTHNEGQELVGGQVLRIDGGRARGGPGRPRLGRRARGRLDPGVAGHTPRGHSIARPARDELGPRVRHARGQRDHAPRPEHDRSRCGRPPREPTWSALGVQQPLGPVDGAHPPAATGMAADEYADLHLFEPSEWTSSGSATRSVSPRCT